MAGHGDRRAGESIGCAFSLLLRPDEVLISVRAEPVEASANPWPGSGRTVQISKGRINKRRPTTRLRSQNNCQHWVLAPHATGGYGCQQKGSIGNVACVHHGAGLFCKPFSRPGQGYRSPSGHMATYIENAMRRGGWQPNNYWVCHAIGFGSRQRQPEQRQRQQ